MLSLVLAASVAFAPQVVDHLERGPASVAPDLLLASEAPPDTLTTTLRGRVVSATTGEPIAGALVEIGSGSDHRTAYTDGQGRYLLTGVPSGSRRLLVRALDHAPLGVSVRVPRNGRLVLDLSLRLRPVELPAIRVVGGSRPGREGAPNAGSLTPTSSSAAELRALESSPGLAEFGLAQSARSATGTDATEPSSLLFVRGATSDLKMVLLDGAPVFAPFHLSGIVEPVQPGILDSSRVYLGGAPARYNGGLSYILDLETRPGRSDRTRVAGQGDLLSGRLQAEGPLGPGSYYLGTRGIHQLGEEALTGGEDLPYGYGDALFRADVPVSDRDVIAATGFWNRESVGLEGQVRDLGSVHWGNVAGSVRYLRSLDDGEVELTGAAGQFRTRLPVGSDPVRAAEGRSTRSRMAVDVSRLLDGLWVNYGAAYDHYGVSYRNGSTATGLPSPERTARGEMMGLYGDVAVPLSRKVQLRGGLRSDLFLPSVNLRASPRLTVALRAGENTRFSASAGRYHQYVRAPETILSADLTAWSGSAEREILARSHVRSALEIASANHFLVALDHRPRPEFRLGAEAFYKSFDNVPSGDDVQASGLDLWFDWNPSGEWSARAGYLLAWVWSAEVRQTSGDGFAGRHLLTGALSAPLPSEVTLDFHLAASAGLPFTPIPTASGGGETVISSGNKRNAQPTSTGFRSEPLLIGAPDGSYLRVDVKLSRSLVTRVLDTELHLTPYLKLLNALDNRDSLFYQFDNERDLRPRSLASVPVLPVIGVSWDV